MPLVFITCEHCIYIDKDGKCGKDGDCNIKDIRNLIEEEG